jgi:hypothetical protein
MGHSTSGAKGTIIDHDIFLSSGYYHACPFHQQWTDVSTDKPKIIIIINNNIKTNNFNRDLFSVYNKLLDTVPSYDWNIFFQIYFDINSSPVLLLLWSLPFMTQ